MYLIISPHRLEEGPLDTMRLIGTTVYSNIGKCNVSIIRLKVNCSTET